MTTSSDWVTPVLPVFINGAVDVEQRGDALVPHRLPAWARDYYSDPGLAMNKQDTHLRHLLKI